MTDRPSYIPHPPALTVDQLAVLTPTALRLVNGETVTMEREDWISWDAAIPRSRRIPGCVLAPLILATGDTINGQPIVLVEAE